MKTNIVRNFAASLCSLMARVAAVLLVALGTAPAGAATKSIIVVQSSQDHSAETDTVTFTVTVQKGSGVTPTGTIILRDAVRMLNPDNRPLDLSSDGRVSLKVSGLVRGVHSITAQYSGDTAYSNGFSPVLIQNVDAAKKSTTITIGSSANPSTQGLTVTFSATVSPATATGNVTFTDEAGALGTSAVANGMATYATSALTVGAHSIVASYTGDDTYSVSNSTPLLQHVKGTVTVTVSSNPNPAASGQQVTFTASVKPDSGTVTPTGSVIFYDGTTPLGASVPLSNGGAKLSTTTLTAGSHSITAAYTGDNVYPQATSGPLTQTVNGSGSTVVTLTVTPTVPPASHWPKVGDLVTFTVDVTYGGVPVNSGNVTISDPPNHIFATGLAVTNGTTTYKSSSIPAGQYSMVATYGAGNAPIQDATSNSVNLTVDSASVPGGTLAPRVTIGASLGPVDGDVRPLWLTFKNTASEAVAKQITLSATSFRVLGGAGEVVVASPTLPAVVGDLAPGESRIITLLMRVPIGTKELAVTDSGVYQGPDGTQYRFSFGQVVFP